MVQFGPHGRIRSAVRHLAEVVGDFGLMVFPFDFAISLLTQPPRKAMRLRPLGRIRIGSFFKAGGGSLAHFGAHTQATLKDQKAI